MRNLKRGGMCHVKGMSGRHSSLSTWSKVVVVSAILGMGGAANALELVGDSDSDVKVRWDNTIKMSGAYRLANPSNNQTAVFTAKNPLGLNLDDGDRNFRKGIVSERLDIFSELDFSYKNVGARVSGAAWYDAVYRRANDNDSPATSNVVGGPYNEFTNSTRDLMGGYGEILDAFVYAKGDVFGSPASMRLGRHTLLYGESLYFGSNGIAGAQSPIDVIKAVAVPNSQFKEFIRPEAQLSGQIQITENVALGGYYQFQWEENRLPPVGSYFSFSDLLDKGGQRTLNPFNGTTWFTRGADVKARNNGQFGVQVKVRTDDFGDFGLYAAKFHAKTPTVYYHFDTGQYNLVYPEDIKVYGASYSSTAGPLQFSLEGSVRKNTPLMAPGGFVFGVSPDANNNTNPAYAVGSSAHLNVSGIYNLPRSPFWDGGFLLAELAWNRLLSVDKNPSQLNPTSTRDASALWVSIQPQYFQIVSGVDLTVPISLTYGIDGKSAVNDFSPAAPLHGGSVSIGMVGTYRNNWTATLNYTHFYGPSGQYLDENFTNSYKNVWGDRDFLSFSLQTTF